MHAAQIEIQGNDGLQKQTIDKSCTFSTDVLLEGINAILGMARENCFFFGCWHDLLSDV